jgi:hypothetical protein
MAETPRSTVLRLLAREGYSGSYGTLLVMAVLIGADPDGLTPETDAERFEWWGHLQGLRAALVCLAMYEANLSPLQAAVAVQRHIEDGARIMSDSGGSK